MSTPVVVTLLGKLGHGKTYILNKVTGSKYPSDSRGRSCTLHLQFGYTKTEGIVVVDTPGFYASDDVTGHIGAQKVALEGTKLSGIYIITRCGRAGEIAETVEKIMRVAGDVDFRVIVTHEDVVCQDEGYNKNNLIKDISFLLTLSPLHILIVGKGTSGAAIENFIKSTLHDPMDISLNEDQIALASSLGVGIRRQNKPIQEAEAMIDAAHMDCTFIVENRKSYETDMAILTLQKTTNDEVMAAKENIFRDAALDDSLSEAQRNLIYGKAGLALSTKLRTFMISTNKLLSWDMTDISDARNQYKKCNYCNRVFVKTEGCNGGTTCGLVPSATNRGRPPTFNAVFQKCKEKWVIQYFWDNLLIERTSILSRLREYYSTVPITNTSGYEQIGLGCGRNISWSTMIPLTKEEIRILGDVEMMGGVFEDEFKESFQKSLVIHEAKNLSILSSIYK
jgi:hypothetical protein